MTSKIQIDGVIFQPTITIDAILLDGFPAVDPASLSGDAAGAGVASANVNLDQSLIGSADASGEVSASVGLDQSISGDASGSGEASASIDVGDGLSGDAVGTGTANADAVLDQSVSASATGSGEAVADVNLDQELSAVATGEATASASIELNQSISGSAVGSGIASADIVVGGTEWRFTDVANQLSGHDGSRQPQGSVASWTDFFGNNNDSYQATASRQPTCGGDLNGHRFLSFDGSQDLAVAANTFNCAGGSNTIIGLARSNANAVKTRLYSGLIGNGIRHQIVVNSLDQLGFKHDGAGGSPVLETTIDGTNWFMFIATRDGTTETIRVNGDADITDELAADMSITSGVIGSYARADGTGGSDFWDGDIAMLMFLDGIPSGEEALKIEGRFAHKYNLTSLLDAGHPNKTNPPMV